MSSINLILQMTLEMLFGVMLRKLNIVDQQFGKNLSSMVFNLVLPCLILMSFMGDFSKDLLRKTPVMLGMYIVFMVAMYICAAVANKIINKHDPLSRALLLGTLSPNVTFIGLPLVNELLGADGVICLVIFMIPMRVFSYMVSPLILAHPDERMTLRESIRANWRNMLNPATVAIPVSLALYWAGISFPVPIGKALSAVASMSSPLGMILCGVLLSEIPFQRLFEEKRVIIMVVLRNLIAPAAVFAVLLLLNAGELISKVSLIYCCIPMGVIIAIYTEKYDCGGKYASLAVFLSTVFSIVTIPFWLHMGDMVF